MCLKSLKESEYKALEQMLLLSQAQLKTLMAGVLKKYYPLEKVGESRDYIIAEGDIPIALVAHLDTVVRGGTTEVYYDQRKNALWSPDGLGADDRAGVFAIFQILRTTKLRPHIIFTTDEEKGGLGAIMLASKACPFADLRYIIELDRRGTDDCVFYDCENPEFVGYVESFGFNEMFGSFSDISILCPAWKIAGVNLSIGYRDEHSVLEMLFVSPMLATIEKVKQMLSEEDIPSFEYIPAKYSGMGAFRPYYSTAWGLEPYDETFICANCGKAYLAEEVFPTVSKHGTTVFYCPDCIAGKVEWCPMCGEAFEIENEDQVYCVHCQERIKGAV